MKTLAAFFGFLFFCLSSCNDNSEQKTDTKFGPVKQEMTIDVQKLKGDFVSSYHEASTTLADSFVKQKIQKLYNSIDNTDTYLDSIKSEMDKLGDMDVNNAELIKKTFLYKGVGDSILNKINSSMTIAQEAAITEEQKFIVKKAQDSLFDKPIDQLNEQLFGLTNSAGASIIIYGLRTELYRVGNEALKRDHN